VRRACCEIFHRRILNPSRADAQQNLRSSGLRSDQIAQDLVDVPNR
jgi:hypothetical protein